MEFITQILSEETLYALGWTVIHSLWQAFIIAVVASLVLVALQKKPSKVRYLAANAAMLLVPVWAVVTFIGLRQEALPAEGFAFAAETFPAMETGFWQKIIAACSGYFEQHLPLIVTVWLLGEALFFLKMMGGLLYIQRLKHRYTLPMEDYWQQRLRVLAGELGMKKTVRLAESALVKIPMVIGWLKPVILMPVGAVNNLTTGQVEAILAHELAHIYRHDYILNIFQSIIEILFYFNPAVWWISANIRTERENCCDDIAVQLCGNSLAYAKALVSLQEIHHIAPAFAMPFSKNKNQLLNRIRRILQQPQNKSNVMEKLSATVLLLAAVVMLSVQANTPFGNLLERVVSKKAANDTEYLLPSDGSTYLFSVQNDTIPGSKNKDRRYIRRHDDNEDIEITFDKDKIVSLKINGEVIPEEEFGAYEELAAQMREELDNLPAPPAPLDPLAPLAEPGFAVPPAPPAPPAPPSFEGRSRKIITKKDGNGTTFIIETEPGSDPVQIRMKDGKNGAIIINGQEIKGLKKGDQTVIIEKVDGDAPLAYYFGKGNSWDGAALAFPEFPPEPDNYFKQREDIFTQPKIRELLRSRELNLAAPQLAPEWNAEKDRWMQELQERMKDGNLSKEWMEQFNEEMRRSIQPRLMEMSEPKALLEAERARILDEHQQMRQGQLLKMEELQKENLFRYQKDLERVQRELEREQYRRAEKSRSGRRLINNSQ